MSGSTIFNSSCIFYCAVVVLLFAVLPVRKAALASFFGGWMLLPVADFPPNTITVQRFTVDIIGVALPSNIGVNKGLVVPLVTLLGVVKTIGTDVWRSLRWTISDFIMGAFCLTPLFAVVAGASPFSLGIAQVAYLATNWGASWLIGRLVLTEPISQLEFAKAMRLVGLGLLPIAVCEGLKPAWLYERLYGPHPFSVEGAARYFGFRPLGFFEHGNQYGIWIALSALAAWWLVRQEDAADRGIFPTVSAVAISVAAIASQSAGAMILLLAGCIYLLIGQRWRQIAVASVAIIIGFGGALYLSGKVPVEKIATQTAIGKRAVALVVASGRGSIGYRVRRDQRAIPMIFKAPISGYGSWDWWRPLLSHPWGLPLLLAGQFGLLSLALMAAAMLLRAGQSLLAGSSSLLPLVVICGGCDALLNSYIYFPAILAAGALANASWPNCRSLEQPLKS